MEEKIVIVGGGQGAFSTATRLREIGHRGAITIVGEEEHLPYQRPPLSKAYLLGKTDAERLGIRPRDYFDDLDIEMVLGRRALRLNRTERHVELSDSTIIPYGKLVLATGSRARTLPDELSQALSGVFTLRTLSDSERLKVALSTGSRRVLVVGGGFVGLEVAAISSQMGHVVTVIEASGRLLSRVACDETADAIAKLHQRHGVIVKTGTTILRLLSRDGAVAGACLSNGSKVDSDVVVVGIGGVANDELAVDAGLTTKRGVVVDHHSRTSDPNIFAVGDCAVFPFGGRMVRIESVQNASDQGTAVAATIVGETSPYVPVPWFWSDQFDAKLQTVGLATGYDQVISVAGPRAGSSANWYFRDGNAVAVDTINDPKTHMAAKRLLARGLAPTLEQLSNPDFDLAALARSTNDPLRKAV